MNELKHFGNNLVANLNFYINDLRLFEKFLTNCYFQLFPDQDPYEKNIHNFFDPYKNAYQ